MHTKGVKLMRYTCNYGYIRVVVRRHSVEFENVEQIIELSMNISTHGKSPTLRNTDLH